MLIYYEDLITDPVNEMRKLLEFFDVKSSELLTEEFLHEIRMKTLDSYHEQHLSSGGSHSKGEDLEFHTKQFSKDVISDIDRYMENSYPDLWERYLKRFRYEAP